jgi:hypothetical protein|tara:strand:- start:1593 stop:1769 length:177 start_codon:yes stop_codon:yes gene_type:complete
MPKVNGKEFPYTKEGMREAKAYAKKTGKKITNEGYKGGKSIKVENYQDLVKKKFGGRL